MLIEISDKLCNVKTDLEKVLVMCEDLNSYLSENDMYLSFYRDTAMIKNLIALEAAYEAAKIIENIQVKIKEKEVK